MRSGHGYSRDTVVQGPTPWSRIYISGALVPAEFLFGTSFVKWLGGVLVYHSEILGKH